MCDWKTKRQRRACFSEQQTASDSLGKAEERGRDVGVQTECCHSVLTPNLLFLKTEKVLNVFRQVKAKSIPPTDSLGRSMLFLVTMANTWQQFKGENILFQFMVWEKHGGVHSGRSMVIADWKQMRRGRRVACSYQVPSLAVYVIPSQALGPAVLQCPSQYHQVGTIFKPRSLRVTSHFT